MTTFERHLWPLMVAKEKPEAARAASAAKELREAAAGPALQQAVRKCALKPSVVFREIVSFIKGRRRRSTRRAAGCRATSTSHSGAEDGADV